MSDGPPPLGTLSWDAVSGTTMASRIISQITSVIVAGTLQPGQRLGTEKTIAEEFGVSRMAVRDAVRGLEALGAVDVRVGPRGGVYIGKHATQKLSDTLAIQFALTGMRPQEVLDAQVAIEKAAISMATSSISPVHIARLQAGLDSFTRDMAEDSTPTRIEAFVPRVIALHVELVEASGNRVLTSLFQSLRLLLAPLYLHVAQNNPAEEVDKAIRRVMSSHRELLDLVAQGDHTAAQLIIETRLTEIRDALGTLGG
ncbi:FadR/GntR family transcriptional regulator [Williamsia soli]|uniref:FadR/GntR family transcriptional regulator n=1 Tax=Williamsia soli TaxID=364929 RepID=UPI001A9E30A1|nr:FCD domain-containing protein [Williamsia soli]